MAVTPPRPKGPPLNALRAFEAAARLGGFARAAEELCVTPGAVAQQVRQLEDWAGAALFERRAQGVVLTELGQTVRPELQAAFDALGAAIGALRAAARPARLHVAALPAVAQLWLSPRLPGLRAALPEAEISVTAMEQPPNLDREPFDLTVFFGPGDGRRIEQDRIFPVCAPAMAARIASVGDLARLPCLNDSSWSDDWPAWLRAQGADIRVSGPVYSLYALAVEEAVNGAGVLMGHEALVARHLTSGALVKPFEHAVALPRWLEFGTRSGVPAPPLLSLIRLLGEGRL
ncbi:LysR family transcriptional regulator [Shimia sp.]|uniref:LysR family transcriptional regulator n=1 Tax=Shimia sp. TaxID=1954381 RepID=UPI0035681AFC